MLKAVDYIKVMKAIIALKDIEEAIKLGQEINVIESESYTEREIAYSLNNIGGLIQFLRDTYDKASDDDELDNDMSEFEKLEFEEVLGKLQLLGKDYNHQIKLKEEESKPLYMLKGDRIVKTSREELIGKSHLNPKLFND